MEYVKFISGLIILIFSGKYLVEGGVSLAKHFNISTLVIGVTVVAFGTSAPELIVSVNAAISGSPEIAFGNIVGSNIANIGLVLAITAILIPIPVNRISFRFDWPFMMLASILLFVFTFNDVISFYEGLILFLILIVFIYFAVSKGNVKKDEAKVNETDEPKFKLILSVIIIVISSFGLAFGADFLVDGASSIATSWGVSKRVISITIVAFGTSVPELTASVIAAFNKETDISIGNIIGSNIFNIMAVLGITSMVKEIPIDHIAFSFDIIWMLFVSVLLFLFIFPFKTIYLNRAEGMLLLLSYIIYISLVLGGFDFESFTQSFAQLVLNKF
ncbi:MAG: calcium/sodium antiporter [Bacteroidales bacterium]|nr:calcium/sodium antiporter [Bacteroidales bacterium]MBN2756018.1 calcium/sodium antiporter [Bacteroidales bacterium]